MTEKTNADPSTLAKEAFVLHNQLEALEDAMIKGNTDASGYTAYSTNYNAILVRARQVLALDSVLLGAIKHLGPYKTTDGTEFGDYRPEDDHSSHFGRLKADVPVLRATMKSFFALYMPPDQKRSIGFGSREE